MGRRSGPTLAERSQAVLGQPEPEAPSSPPPEPRLEQRTRPVGRRHCWVADLPDLPGRRFAGLVVAWRADSDGWSGRTIYVVDEQGDAVVVEAWVPARHLHPL